VPSQKWYPFVTLKIIAFKIASWIYDNCYNVHYNWCCPGIPILETRT
jgi:hypothetical protein